MDKGAWRAIVHGVTKNQTWLKWLSAHTHMFLQTARKSCVLGKAGECQEKKDDNWIGPLIPVCVDPAMHRAASNLTGVFVQIKMSTSSSEWIQCDGSLVSKMWAEFQPTHLSAGFLLILSPISATETIQIILFYLILGCIELINVELILRC